jgi:hypothetical protein
MVGYFIDADSICIEPFDDYFHGKTAFATFENENIRKDLVATGTMGFVPKHPLCRDIIQWISSPDAIPILERVKAWGAVGPGLLTKFLQTGNYKDFSVFPSHCFLPIHFTGNTYLDHKKVYAYQAWGATNNSYSIINNMELPNILKEPNLWVSVLICSFNTCRLYIKECLESIKSQNGVFGIEVVWVNDGSDEKHTEILEDELNMFEKRSRFCKFVYHKTSENKGVAMALNYGIDLCSHELIFRMDSDDIMIPNRIKTQIEFMKNTKDCVLCGTNINIFTNPTEKEKKIITTTEHPNIIKWERLQEVYREHGSLPSWFMNHPTLCYYKNAILSIGKYRTDVGSLEDYDMELRMIKKYGVLYNIKESMLMYRSHPNQITQNIDDNLESIIDGILNDVFRGDLIQ